MVEGWLLAFPAVHVLSLADLSFDDWDGFSELLENARSLLRGAYGSTVMFEHGSAGVGRLAACGVDHAHMHLVPLDIDLRAAISNLAGELGEFEWTRIEGRVEPIAEEDYIFISDRTGSWVTRSSHLPSQVVRRAIALELGISEWDWKKDARPGTVSSTRARLRDI
ncbi:hypothetical protein QCD70_06715 [Agreia sp. PsM10]|uniref:hypothetical protein n=1 Tax=Agreia sp. PsM10 TaxID=3030533 RepID=UPI00263BAD00|nr:hypothetical protein [Agreia sp. PsM10]MDN4639928.1 hypothetical protein [Agreia sp. PsM10]